VGDVGYSSTTSRTLLFAFSAGKKKKKRCEEWFYLEKCVAISREELPLSH
jgi:hypothetical protein